MPCCSSIIVGDDCFCLPFYNHRHTFQIVQKLSEVESNKDASCLDQFMAWIESGDTPIHVIHKLLKCVEFARDEVLPISFHTKIVQYTACREERWLNYQIITGLL